MKYKLHIVGISGSLREGSYNTMLLKSARTLIPEGSTMEIVDIGSLPLYNSDLEVSEPPTTVSEFREALSRADAFVFASPEYNHSVPGTLKNAIDWGSRGTIRPFAGKPVAIMGATQGLWGTLRMQLAFQPILRSLDMISVNKPEVLVAQAQNKFDRNGNLVDEPTIAIIHQQLKELARLARQSQIIKHALEQTKQ